MLNEISFMNEDAEIIWSKYNHIPLQDFQGLTPNEMDTLLYKPYSKNSPVQINDELADQVLDKIPYFRLTEELLKIIAEKGKLKLTVTTHSLPTNTIQTLYSYKFITDPFVEDGTWKIKREKNSDLFTTLNITTRGMEFIKFSRGELVFTKSGIEWLKTKDRNKLLKVLMKTFTENFNWAYNDGHPAIPIGQLGWGYSIFLLSKFGDKELPIKFYSDLYFEAFPSFVEQYPVVKYWTPKEGCQMTYTIRTVNRFMEWFGLVQTTRCDFPIDREHGAMKKTELLNQMFKVGI